MLLFSTTLPNHASHRSVNFFHVLNSSIKVAATKWHYQLYVRFYHIHFLFSFFLATCCCTFARVIKIIYRKKNDLLVLFFLHTNIVWMIQLYNIEYHKNKMIDFFRLSLKPQASNFCCTMFPCVLRTPIENISLHRSCYFVVACLLHTHNHAYMHGVMYVLCNNNRSNKYASALEHNWLLPCTRILLWTNIVWFPHTKPIAIQNVRFSKPFSVVYIFIILCSCKIIFYIDSGCVCVCVCILPISILCLSFVWMVGKPKNSVAFSTMHIGLAICSLWVCLYVELFALFKFIIILFGWSRILFHFWFRDYIWFHMG